VTTPTVRLWELRDRRVPAVAAAAALTGLPMPLLRDATRVSLAASDEAGVLLEQLPLHIRTLPMALNDHLEHCVHSVRGPVVWSETITARANALGNEDVFVCRTTRRDFDAPLNRALVGVLAEVAGAARALRGPLGDLLDPAERNRIDDRAALARRWRHHRRLADLHPGRLRARDLARIRAGRHAEAAGLILDAVARLHDPLCGEDVEGLSDAPTRDMHRFVLDCLVSGAASLPEPGLLELDRGALCCGWLSFRHPSAVGTSGPGLCVDGSPVAPAGGEGWPAGAARVGAASEVAEMRGAASG
jgi:hypothetical protein